MTKACGGCCDTLRRARYQVLEARDGLDGLAVFEAHGAIDLVVTDAVMPHMGGEAMAARMAEAKPDTAFLVCSGYTAEMFDAGFFEDLRHMFLLKPFRPPVLVAAVGRLRARSKSPRTARGEHHAGGKAERS